MRTSFNAFGSFFAVALTTIALSTVVGCAGSDESEDNAQADEAAFSFDMPTETPSESGWAIGMINRACDLDRSVLAGATGSMTQTDDGVIYKASRNGRVIASAWASSKWIGASKKCL